MQILGLEWPLITLPLFTLESLENAADHGVINDNVLGKLEGSHFQTTSVYNLASIVPSPVLVCKPSRAWAVALSSARNPSLQRAVDAAAGDSSSTGLVLRSGFGG